MEGSGGTIRAFIAIDVPKQIRQDIASLLSGLNGFRPVDEANMHITLFFLGDITSEQVECVKAVMDRASFAPFDISINGVGAFTASMPRVLFVGISQGSDKIKGVFHGMQGGIAECCDIEERDFVPHITIARARDVHSSARAAKEFIEKYSSRDFGQFLCNAIALKKSVLTSSGPEYTDLYVKAFS
ncbi:MAG: RNA 2',3'-cyclic phosphodiesterase [Candidatus Marsarchaeota archaeon]|jgi:2'-5' RNA ligase|nr:RNA 2',3'-cyclic phosphodiesterase [Candidatus Marsarchaeota archaeon]MCL5418847.1 RNA 2',3'-cyclic phosphodiesterase [Candidatus Marsarchaeota archaeon]